jgi:glycosyltransferase involved in cell wall biosynthesis
MPAPSAARPNPDVKPRVLFVNTRSTLGADVAVHLTLIEHLNPDEIDVFVATNRHSVDLDATLRWIRRAPRAHLTVCDLGQELSGDSRLGKALSALRNIPALFTLLRLAALVRRERITVLHTTDRPRDAAFTTLLGRMTGAAVVLHVHLKWSPSIGGAARWAAQSADAVLGISEFVCESLVDGGIPPARVAMAYNATDTTQFDPATVRRGLLRSRLQLDETTPLVGLIGRFIPWKGHLDLVNAFAQVHAAVPEARLVLMGRLTAPDAGAPTDYLASIRERISALDLTSAVHWAEWSDDVPAVMTDLDVLAVPSWEEPFGLVVTECMAMERPVVGYATGALPELVTNGQEGELVARGDTDALARALVALLRNPALRTDMGKRGRQRVISEFSPRRQADTVATLYRKLSSGEVFTIAPRQSSIVAE